MSIDIKKESQQEEQNLIKVRRELHRIPGIRFDIEETSNYVAEKLHDFKLEVQTGIGKTGVVGLLHGKQNGKTIMYRSDMDALPIKEQNEVAYISKNEGKMHACGHDGHMSIALHIAKILSRHRDEFKGAIKFVFQPAEEGAGGAELMVSEGVLENPKVDAAIGLHIWNYLPIGKVGLRSGPLMGSTDMVTIVIKGRSAHGAVPQDGVDAILISSHIIAALQAIVSREISPLCPSVISIGTIKGGDAFNIIADRVELSGTVRTLDPEIRRFIPGRMEEIIKGICSGFRADYEFNYMHRHPVVVNDEAMTALVTEVAKEVVGEKNVITAEQTMVGEDMSFYLQQVPGCFFFLGGANKAKGLDYPHHNPHFNFDESCLHTGTEIGIKSLLKYLSD
jgi:amidohydrolase